MSRTSTLSVVHLASGDLWAGAEVQLYQLATELDLLPDIDVSAVLMNEGLLAERLRAAGIRVTVLPEGELSSWQILQSLVTLLKATRPAILHTHRQKENVLGSLAAKFARVPFSLRTVHGAPEFGASGLRRRVNQWLDRASAILLQDAVVMVTQELLTQVGRNYPAAKCHVIANGVAEPRPATGAEQPYFRRAGKFNLCFAGRLVPVKRIDVYADIARAMNARSDDRFHFHVFGEGPLEHELRAQLQRDGIEDRVSVWGFVDDMPSALAQMDALVMTSDHEGLPMIMLEAMALGVAVVAHDVGGMTEVLDNGRCGTLVREHTGDAFANAIVRAHDGGELARNAARAAARYRASYTASECAAQYTVLYRQLAG
ncbi:MAG: glycosyltransferase [Pseudomonadota bacterium]